MRSKNLVGKAHAYNYRLDLDVIFFSECPWRNVSFNFGSWPGRDRRNRSRNAAEGRCWTSVFHLNKTRKLSVEWLTIPYLARRKQVPQSAWSKKKKDWCAKLKKSQKIKVLENPTRPSTCEDVLRAFSYQIWLDLACERAFSYQIWLNRACESEALDSSGRVARPGQIEISARHVPGPVTGIWLVSFRTFSYKVLRMTPTSDTAFTPPGRESPHSPCEKNIVKLQFKKLFIKLKKSRFKARFLKL